MRVGETMAGAPCTAAESSSSGRKCQKPEPSGNQTLLLVRVKFHESELLRSKTGGF